MDVRQLGMGVKVQLCKSTVVSDLQSSWCILNTKAHSPHIELVDQQVANPVRQVVRVGEQVGQLTQVSHVEIETTIVGQPQKFANKLVNQS